MIKIRQNRIRILAIIVPLFLLAYSCNRAGRNDAIEKDTNIKLEAIPASQTEITTAAEALAALKSGNERYNNGQFQHIHIKRVTAFDSSETAPFVAILACSDFKIPPEILFDIEKNELVLIRTAANIEDENAIKEITEAAANDHIKLIAVLGHSNCTALKNIIAENMDEAKPKRKIDSAIVADTKTRQPILNETALKNLSQVAKRIKDNKLIDSLVNTGDLLVQKIYYDEGLKKLSFIEM